MNIIPHTPAQLAHFRQMNHACRQIQNGNSNLSERDQLIVSNYMLAVTIASHYQGHGLEIDDLIGFAYIGLCQAADRYQPGPVPFSVYAGFWIRKQLIEALTQYAHPIRLPDHQRRLANRIRLEQKRFFLRTGREPEPQELADMLHEDEQLILSIIFATEPMLSFSEDPDSEKKQSF